MTKEKFLSRRWNNILTLALGAPVLCYILLVLNTSILSNFAGFLGMVFMGAAY